MSFDAFDPRLYTELLKENWSTVKFPQSGEKITLNDHACEHCEEDPNQTYAIFREMDSFGLVGEYAVCKDCYDKEVQRQKQETVTCRDCGEEKPRSETSEWRWYDFYAPQGDEPLTICHDCWDKPTHKNRRAQDKRDRDEEAAHFNRRRY